MICSMPEAKKVDITQHALVPSHTILSEDELKEVLEKFNISQVQLPGIMSNDSVVKALGAKVGSVIKIERTTQTGKTDYFRVVVE